MWFWRQHAHQLWWCHLWAPQSDSTAGGVGSEPRRLWGQRELIEKSVPVMLRLRVCWFYSVNQTKFSQHTEMEPLGFHPDEVWAQTVDLYLTSETGETAPQSQWEEKGVDPWVSAAQAPDLSSNQTLSQMVPGTASKPSAGVARAW